jgi:uncharacterized membrane protein YphA (DoxX/SURF4 family)
MGGSLNESPESAGRLRWVLCRLARLLLASVFLLSGLVKAVDPLGTAYKVQDYLMAAGLDGWLHLGLPISFLLNTFEVVLGAALLIGAYPRVSVRLVWIFMCVMTPVTLYIALTDPVPDCGCFGDALVISNWGTFLKNMVLLLAAGWLWRRRRLECQPFAIRYQAACLTAVTVGVVGLSLYSWLYLPVIDFRPWRIGQHIPSAVTPVRLPTVERVFVYAHTETGAQQQVPEAQIMQGLVPTAGQWEFVRREERVLDPGIPAQIENFSIHDEWGENLTEWYLQQPGDLFIVVAYDLAATHAESFEHRLLPLAQAATAAGHTVIFLTASNMDVAPAFAAGRGMPFPFYQTDERALKTMIRSNPGLVRLRDGKVIGKWPYRRLPDEVAL